MSAIDIHHNNHDAVFKDALTVFHGHAFDFLGLQLPPIRTALATEFTEIATEESRLDMNFLLEDGSILHLEEEASLSSNDLIRFAAYDVKLFNQYRSPIHTLIFCIHKTPEENPLLNAGSFLYRPQVYSIGSRDAEAALRQLREDVAAGHPVNPLRLIFLPLMASPRPKIDLLYDVIILEKQLPHDIRLIEKIIALTLAAANNLVDKTVLEKFWEDVRMFKFIEFAEEKGLEKGLEQGREQGLEQGRLQSKRDTALQLLTKKFKYLPPEYRDKLLTLDSLQLDAIIGDIFEIGELRDLERYWGGKNQ